MKITTLAKNLSKQSQDERDENIIDNPNKIIDLSDWNQKLKNIELLLNMTDRLIYGINRECQNIDL